MRYKTDFYRLRKHFPSVKDAAAYLGVDVRTAFRWLNGQPPSPQNQLLIEQALIKKGGKDARFDSEVEANV